MASRRITELKWARALPCRPNAIPLGRPRGAASVAHANEPAPPPAPQSAVTSSTTTAAPPKEQTLTITEGDKVSWTNLPAAFDQCIGGITMGGPAPICGMVRNYLNNFAAKVNGK